MQNIYNGACLWGVCFQTCFFVACYRTIVVKAGLEIAFLTLIAYNVDISRKAGKTAARKIHI